MLTHQNMIILNFEFTRMEIEHLCNFLNVCTHSSNKSDNLYMHKDEILDYSDSKVLNSRAKILESFAY